MKNKFAREIIYESIKYNYTLINSKISVIQKRMMLKELNSLVPFFENYSVNRKKYLLGRASVTEKPGDYNNSIEYGINTSSIEGFFFRRIEFDGIPPGELLGFLNELKKEIITSFSSSEYNSNMSANINSGELIVNSHTNSNNKMGFLLRTIENSYFIECNSMKLTKLEVKGKTYWRIVFNEGNDFITLNNNLNKI
jgi:hypothetical protein